MSSKISVIMPAYKAAATIAAALRSIRDQTVRVHEVIVVDGGSPDDTAELVARDFPEVRLLRQPNAGPAVARNNGAQAATRDWLAFLMPTMSGWRTSSNGSFLPPRTPRPRWWRGAWSAAATRISIPRRISTRCGRTTSSRHPRC